MSMVTVAMVVLPITPTPAAIPPPRHVPLFEFSASTPPQTSPKSSWFSPNNGRAALFLLCEICHALGRLDEVAGHAADMEERSAKKNDLMRTRASARIWLAVARRAKGD